MSCFPYLKNRGIPFNLPSNLVILSSLESSSKFFSVFPPTLDLDFLPLEDFFSGVEIIFSGEHILLSLLDGSPKSVQTEFKLRNQFLVIFYTQPDVYLLYYEHNLYTGFPTRQEGRL